MITNFKIFENNIEFEEGSYCVIYGNQSKIIDLIDHLMADTNIQTKYKYSLPNVKNALSSYIYKDIIGCFIFKRKNDFSFNTFIDEYGKNLLYGNIRNQYNFKGEMKIENDKIIIDPLEVDLNKYNL